VRQPLGNGPLSCCPRSRDSARLRTRVGSNFDVVVTVAASEEAVSKIVGLLTSKYECAVVAQ
jgi:hypothetical protein